MVANQLRFDGRVAIVTGAGGGLGRTYALDLARRGCAVVVNDLGGGRHGEGKGSVMADQVVDEIKRAGGKAVANYDSVEFGDRIVATAVEAFGKVDIVVNNAGILRDKAFLNMSELDYELIFKVHMKGAYSVTKAAWPHMRKNKFGRVITTASNAAIYGNFGQANYSAAKLALVGFAKTLAIEGAKYNIHTNAIVPTAGSRLTQTVMPDDVVAALDPEFVTPLTTYLVHESCDTNGAVLEAGGGWYGQLQWYRSEGVVTETTSAEAVRDNWEQIMDMSKAHNLSNVNEATGAVLQAVAEAAERRAAASTGDDDDVVGWNSAAARASKMDPTFFEYNQRDAIIYALGIGATRHDLRLVFEGDDDFGVFPTFSVAPAMAANQLASVRGVVLDLSHILHGEQYIESFAALPTEAKLRSEARVVDVLDKKSGALIITDVDTYNADTGEHLARNQFSTFQVGAGGFGGPKSNPEEKPCVPVPDRSPDSTVEERTHPDAAALYRQGSGDLNPLHIDASFAAIMGFKEPILHGLCTLGHAVRHVVDQYAKGDHTQFKAVKVRFSKAVLPGQTLITEMWVGRDPSRVHFQTRVKETNLVAISNAYVDFKSPVGKPPSARSTATAPTDDSSSLASAAVFADMAKRVNAALVKKVNGVFLWVVRLNGKEVGKWTVDLKTGEGAVYAGEPKNGLKPNTTLILDDGDLVKLVQGKLNAQQAFMSGKLKIKGNLMLTQKLQTLFKDANAKM